MLTPNGSSSRSTAAGRTPSASLIFVTALQAANQHRSPGATAPRNSHCTPTPSGFPSPRRQLKSPQPNSGNRLRPKSIPGDRDSGREPARSVEKAGDHSRCDWRRHSGGRAISGDEHPRPRLHVDGGRSGDSGRQQLPDPEARRYLLHAGSAPDGQPSGHASVKSPRSGHARRPRRGPQPKERKPQKPEAGQGCVRGS
jgi:hypothetical protein